MTNTIQPLHQSFSSLLNFKKPSPKNAKSVMNRHTRILATVTGLLVAVQSHAASITMNATDAAGTSSFNSGLHWTGGAAPTSGNDYFTGAFTLRTPGTAGDYTFAGDSLSLDSRGGMNLKTSPGTIAFNNLILNGGKIANGQGTVTLAGIINVATNSTLDTQTRNATISAAIGGSNDVVEVSLTGGGGTSGNITLSAYNSFNGRWVINDASNSVGLLALVTLADPNALQGATLSLTTTNINALKFGPGFDTFTLGGLAGTGSFGLTNTSGDTAITLQVGNNNGAMTYSGRLSGGGSLTKLGSGTLTLSGTNTYSGSTAISAGTLALGSNGSISNSSSLAIAAGASYDVSAIAAYDLGSRTALSASGTGTAVGTSAATIVGGTTVSLGAQPITLTYDGSHPALSISQGTLSLNCNTFIVNSASPLAPGSYTIIQQASGTISSAGTYNVYGTAIGSGNLGSIQVSGANVNLVVTPAGAPVRIALTSGNNQHAGLGKALASPLVVTVTSASSNRISGVSEIGRAHV